MPPFGRLAAIIVSSENQAEAAEAARMIGRAAPRHENMAVFGPAPAPLAMLRGRHRLRLLVHAARAVPVQDIIRDWLGGLSWKSSVRVASTSILIPSSRPALSAPHRNDAGVCMSRILLFLLALVRPRLPGARRRHLGRRPLGGAGRRDRVRRGWRGGRLRPWLGLRGRAQPDRHQRPCRRPGGRRARPSRIGVVPSEGAQATRARIVAIDPARDLALLEIEQGALHADPALCRPARRRRAGRRSGLSGQCRSRHRALGRRLYHAAAADPLGRHLLQRPADQRHHHPAPHRQHRPRPFGRAAARPVRPGARRQHPDHPQPGRRRALRLRRRQSRAHRLPPPGRASPSRRSTTECV